MIRTQYIGSGGSVRSQANIPEEHSTLATHVLGLWPEITADTRGHLYLYCIARLFRGFSGNSVDIAFGVRSFAHYSVRTLA